MCFVWLFFFYLLFFSIKALCEEQLSSCLPRALLPCPFPVKGSYWHTSSIFFWQIKVLSSHWLSLFGPPKSWWKEGGWLQSVYTGSPLAAVPGVLLEKLKMKLDVEQGINTRTLQLRLLMFTLHSKTPAESAKSPHTSVIFINCY